jgi:hypothetical protein
MQIQQVTHDTTYGIVAGALASLSTLFVGADPAGLTLGLFAALLMTFFMGSIDSRTKAFCGVLLGSLLAGFGMPVVANIILGFMPSLKDVMTSLKPLVSIGIGGAAPMLVPSAIEAAKRWINNQVREVK